MTGCCSINRRSLVLFCVPKQSWQVRAIASCAGQRVTVQHEQGEQAREKDGGAQKDWKKMVGHRKIGKGDGAQKDWKKMAGHREIGKRWRGTERLKKDGGAQKDWKKMAGHRKIGNETCLHPKGCGHIVQMSQRSPLVSPWPRMGQNTPEKQLSTLHQTRNHVQQLLWKPVKSLVHRMGMHHHACSQLCNENSSHRSYIRPGMKEKKRLLLLASIQ